MNEWSSAEDRIGPIPYLNDYEILKVLSRYFTSKDNPAGTSKSNIQFQRDLNAMIQGDNEYYTSPTLARLCKMVARIMHQWEALTAESNRMGGHVPSGTKALPVIMLRAIAVIAKALFHLLESALPLLVGLLFHLLET